ncbi:Putative archaeal flagellar protein G [Geoglobus ahangari]|uniref:Putative archaeal flagellar protein G n=1 Tax=Geoglobus ahangari TaxID=113653 RepID=A0A0F7IFU7_9EURY|nr:hypothetical protein [Geoglobus ahangari]AKG90732.1 Putative archaeal flagellar protein G [Geoglobus ahangari]NOY11551.1 hypothetical protein [Archaeoglobi archaeon]
MGFGEVATHLIIFITAVIIASSASAVMFITVQKIAIEANEQGENLKKLVGTDFEIINDPVNVVYNSTLGAYIIYLKNTGTEELYTTNKTLTVMLNGTVVDFTSDKVSIKPGETATLYVYTPQLSGDVRLSVISDVGVKKTFEFQG